MQSIIPETLLSLQHDPHGLETTYREQPDAFARALSVALDRDPESLALRIWAARLDLALAEVGAGHAEPRWAWANALTPERARTLLWATVGLIALAGTWAKLPTLLGWTGDLDSPSYEAFYARYTPFFAALPLIALFALRYRPSRQVLLAVAGGVGVLLMTQALRPIDTDAGILSTIHTPLLLVALASVVAMGARWREVGARIGVLQLAGETAAFTALLMMGGVALVGITASLFAAIGMSPQVVIEWVAVYGALGAMPVAALVASQRAESGRVAPLVARVFGPMALAVLAVYLPLLVASGGLADRDSLLALNVTLVAVLALVILMQAERPDVARHWTDGVAFALVALALVADLAALGSITGRLAGGLTPNRLAVVGLNALAAVHLAGLVVPLGRRALGRGEWPGDGWTARCLTVYTAWAAFVVFVLPFLF